MRAALDEEIPEPSRDELQAYFRKHPDRFRTKPGDAEKIVDFDQIEWFVRQDWIAQRGKETRDRKLAELRERYDVVVTED